MPTLYNTVYRGNFCDDKSGGNVAITFSRRMDSESPIPIPRRIIFAGRNNSPVKVEYKDNGEFKLVAINGSSCQVNIKAIGDFELSSLYTADEKEWRVDITDSFTWSGFLIPDSCNEPYASKPYDVSVRATDGLGTLKDLPFLQSDDTKYKGYMSDKELISEILLKTGLRLPIAIGVNTFESIMDPDICPLSQTYINLAAFYNDDNNPLNCEEVLNSVLARWSVRLHQFNGKWQVINILEKSFGNIDTWEFDSDGNTQPRTVVGNDITAGGFNRALQPTSANCSFAKALAQSLVYYKYGYTSNELVNGDFNDAMPPALPNDWTPTTTFTGRTYFRTDKKTGFLTTDVVLVISNTGAGDYLINDIPVQIRALEKVNVSFDLAAIDAADFPPGKRRVQILVKDDLGKYFTNDGWTTTSEFYEVVIDYKDFKNQINITFEVDPQATDYQFEIGLKNVYSYSLSGQYETQINNVKIQPQVSAGLKNPALGVIKKLTLKAPQTFKGDQILLLHGDEYNNQRTSQISVGSATVITPPVSWSRNNFPSENKSLLHIVADSKLRTHAKPYRIFEAEFVGPGYIDINTLLTIDLLEGTYIFLSGRFDLKLGIHQLRFAQVLNDAYEYIEEPDAEDYGH